MEYRKYDAEPYYNTDPEGYKLLLLDDEPVGTISVVKHCNKFGFMGLLIIKNEYRHNGYGNHLFEFALNFLESRLSSQGNIGLYAVLKEIPRYAKFGFKSAFQNNRYVTKVFPSKVANNQNVFTPGVLSLQANIPLFSQVVDYDQQIFSSHRQKLLAHLINMPKTSAFAYSSQNKIQGYGIIRACYKGYKIGPLYADNLDIAKILINDLLNSVAMANQITHVTLDMPDNNKFTHILAEYFKLEPLPEFNTEAMYKHNIPNAISTYIEKNYAMCSLELG